MLGGAAGERVMLYDTEGYSVEDGGYMGEGAPDEEDRGKWDSFCSPEDVRRVLSQGWKASHMETFGHRSSRSSMPLWQQQVLFFLVVIIERFTVLSLILSVCRQAWAASHVMISNQSFTRWAPLKKNLLPPLGHAGARFHDRIPCWSYVRVVAQHMWERQA